MLGARREGGSSARGTDSQLGREGVWCLPPGSPASPSEESLVISSFPPQGSCFLAAIARSLLAASSYSEYIL